MGIQVVLPSSLREWHELERELDYLFDSHEDEYLELCRAYAKVSDYFMMAWVLDSANWVLPESECSYWNLPLSTKVMCHPYVWDFIHDFIEGEDDKGNPKWADKAFLKFRGGIKTTTAKTIVLRSILKDPEVTWFYISQNLKLAKQRIKRIKQEILSNVLLKRIGHDVFYENPQNDKGSTFYEEGFTVKRKSVRDELTLKAVGLESRLPTGDHPTRHCFDDCENEESVSGDTARRNIMERFESTMSLRDNYDYHKVLFGTLYHYDGIHLQLRRKGIFDFHIQPAEDLSKDPPDGYPTLEGAPVFIGPDILAKRRKDKSGDYYPQDMLDPKGKSEDSFEYSYLLWYSENPFVHARKNICDIYVVLDPSSGRKNKWNDPSFIGVFGLGRDKYWHFLDAHLWKLDPVERVEKVIEKVLMWNSERTPIKGIICDGNALSSDSTWIRRGLQDRGKTFPVRGVMTNLPKITTENSNYEGRINTFVLSMLKSRRWKFPRDLKIKSSEWNGKRNFVEEYLWKEEMTNFGFTNNDHALDGMALPFLPYKSSGKTIVPNYIPPNNREVVFRNSESRKRYGSWMSL